MLSFNHLYHIHGQVLSGTVIKQTSTPLGAKQIPNLIGAHVNCWRVYELSGNCQSVRIGDTVRVQNPGEMYGAKATCYTLKGIWAEMKDCVIVWAEPIAPTDNLILLDIRRRHFACSFLDRVILWLRPKSMLDSKAILEYPVFT